MITVFTLKDWILVVVVSFILLFIAALYISEKFVDFLNSIRCKTGRHYMPLYGVQKCYRCGVVKTVLAKPKPYENEDDSK